MIDSRAHRGLLQEGGVRVGVGAMKEIPRWQKCMRYPEQGWSNDIQW